MLVPMQSAVKVLCRGTASQRHPRREIARYSWSEDDEAWVRIDHGDSGRDLTGGLNADGRFEMSPRPVFECPCGQRPVYTHDQIQQLIKQAASQGEHLTV